MGTLRHLVVAVDGSEPSIRATEFAVDLARRVGAGLSFCHAVDPALTCMPVAQGAMVTVESLLDTLDESARAVCIDAVARAKVAGVSGSANVVHGGAAHGLIEFATDNAADAIVVGTHGRRGIARTILGSVAAAVVRSSPVPVFCVHQDAALANDGPIVVAVDGSAPSDAARAFACRLATDLDVPLHVVHVFDDRDLGFVHDHLGEDVAAVRRRALAATAHDLEESATSLRMESVKFDTELCEGRTVNEIIAAARRTGARMIATGTHGRKGLGRLMLGSVAEALLSQARIPVVTIHA